MYFNIDVNYIKKLENMLYMWYYRGKTRDIKICK